MVSVRKAGVGACRCCERSVKNGIGRASATSAVVVVSVVTLGRRLERWKRVEVRRKVRVLTRTRVMVGCHHYTTMTFVAEMSRQGGLEADSPGF